MTDLFNNTNDCNGYIQRMMHEYPYSMTIGIEPMGKPRMTQRDKWKKRPAVLRYHAFRDLFKMATQAHIPHSTQIISWIAFFSLPASWSNQKKLDHAGQPHLQKPDRDNIDKAILDSLCFDDKSVFGGEIYKFWDDGKGARLILYWK